MIDCKLTIDNFLSSFDELRDHCDELSFEGETNPVDGVFYPGVDLDIPEATKDEILANLISMNGGNEVDIKAMFLRLSPKDTRAPHQSHNDSSMGQYSMMLYMNREEDCEGGTSMVRHKSMGFSSNPINSKQLKAWESDHSNPMKWDVYDYCEMLPNRACIFKAEKMHRSEPVGGFGADSKNARLVLVCFFDLAE